MSALAIESRRIPRIFEKKSVGYNILTRRPLKRFEAAIQGVIPKLGIVFEAKMTRQLQDIIEKADRGEVLTRKEKKMLDDYERLKAKQTRDKNRGTGGPIRAR